jgi:hypothetical protein
MNRTLRRNWIMAFIILCLIGSLRARAEQDDSSELFADPINVQVKFVPQYFVQLITNDTRYVSIEALINDDPEQTWYEVILMEKTGRRTIYCNSGEDVNSLKQSGQDAYYAPIEFTALEITVLAPIYRIKLHDSYGKEIVWRFIVNTRITEAETGFMSPQGNSSFVLMYANSWAAAATGTTVTIGDRMEAEKESSPRGSQDSGPCQAFYAMGLTITEITPGIRLWYVNSSPVQRRTRSSRVIAL